MARLRWIESNLTAAEIVIALQQAKPPIFASLRTVERDFSVIRDDTRRYLSPGHFDAPFEIGAALMRHEMIARRATQRALESNEADGARWARIAILATQAKTQLLFANTMITMDDLTSDAERAWNYGDAEAAERARGGAR